MKGKNPYPQLFHAVKHVSKLLNIEMMNVNKQVIFSKYIRWIWAMFHIAYQQFKVHINSHFITVECDECSQKFSSVTLLNRHKKRMHPTEDLRVCEICGYVATSKSKMSSHRTQKHEVEKHKMCTICGHTTFSGLKLKFHIDCMHRDSAPHQYFCDDCGKGFIHWESLKQDHKYRHVAHNQ